MNIMFFLSKKTIVIACLTQTLHIFDFVFHFVTQFDQKTSPFSVFFSKKKISVASRPLKNKVYQLLPKTLAHENHQKIKIYQLIKLPIIFIPMVWWSLWIFETHSWNHLGHDGWEDWFCLNFIWPIFLTIQNLEHS